MQTPVTIEPAVLSLNESPSEKEGKFWHPHHTPPQDPHPLNESPSEKEGKSRRICPGELSRHQFPQ